jgi:hypothetical protein
LKRMKENPALNISDAIILGYEELHQLRQYTSMAMRHTSYCERNQYHTLPLNWEKCPIWIMLKYIWNGYNLITY